MTSRLPMIAAVAGLAAIGSMAIGPADNRAAEVISHSVSQDASRVAPMARPAEPQADVASYAVGGAGCLLAGAGLFVVLRRRNAL